MASAAMMTTETQRPAPRLWTSFRMQAKEYRRRVVVLLLILALPVVFFSTFYYTASDDPIPMKVPERSGAVERQIAARETWPVATALMGVAWAAAAAAFFSVAGSLSLDRRLVQSGYRAWQILTARLVLLAGVSVVLSLAALIIFAVLTTSQHPELAWLSALVAGLTATAIGLVLGTLLPRPTEGMIILIGLFGTLMSIPPDSMRYVPTYAAMQLFLAGRFGEDPSPGPFILEGAAVITVLTGVALLLWSWRTRVVRS